ncbi:MAG: DUF72 domain-containing protein [Candidatus Thermoplasmatota archaeon]|nr:DUF72 domain-containing protein [Candidatus Thermoplasmatota archaeon]
MTYFRIGCSGWSYRAWVGPFFPAGTGPADYLRQYSRIFDAVEIDSSFYGTPKASSIDNWKKATPENFLFHAKVPGDITHRKMLNDTEEELEHFLESVGRLGEKLGIVLFQFPPSFTFNEGYADLIRLMGNLPREVKFAMEFRNESWFREEVYRKLRASGIILAWSELPDLVTPEVITTDSVYLRLVGDRSINEKDFGKPVRDRSSKISRWGRIILEKEHELDHVFVSANNHYQGFAPATVNLVREVLGLGRMDWKKILNHKGRGNQTGIFQWE